MNYYYYVDAEDNSPVYLSLDYAFDISEFSYSSSYYDDLNTMKMTLEMNWDKDDNKVLTTISMISDMMDMKADIGIEFSEEYWDLNTDIDDLYVGFSKKFSFDSTIDFNNIEITSDDDYYDDLYNDDSLYDDLEQKTTTDVEIKVTGKEDITVPIGRYENCYILQIKQTQKSESIYETSITTSTSESTTKIWIDENGVMPQAEQSIDTTGFGSSSMKLTQKLESYSSSTVGIKNNNF